WTETWPEEKSISIENPYFGELNFPGEEKENKQEKDKDKNKSKEKTKGPETKNNSKEPKKTGNDSVNKPGTEDIDDTLPKQPGAEE
ncbi:MAG: rod shape-determining protein MreC, partial [Leptospira sp.]|nr:rod shape-determining protein MreC [Leptospira sp.]